MLAASSNSGRSEMDSLISGSTDIWIPAAVRSSVSVRSRSAVIRVRFSV